MTCFITFRKAQRNDVLLPIVASEQKTLLCVILDKQHIKSVHLSPLSRIFTHWVVFECWIRLIAPSCAVWMGPIRPNYISLTDNYINH